MLHGMQEGKGLRVLIALQLDTRRSSRSDRAGAVLFRAKTDGPGQARLQQEGAANRETEP